MSDEIRFKNKSKLFLFVSSFVLSYVFCVIQSGAMLGWDVFWLGLNNEPFAGIWMVISLFCGTVCVLVGTLLAERWRKLHFALLFSLPALAMNWFYMTSLMEI